MNHNNLNQGDETLTSNNKSNSTMDKKNKKNNTTNSTANKSTNSKSGNNPVDFLYKMKRAPNKRRVKPVDRLQFDLNDEMWEDTSSDDEDYKPKKGINDDGDDIDDDDDEDDDDFDSTRVTSQGGSDEDDGDDDDDDDASDSSEGHSSSDAKKKLKRDTEDDSQESQEIPMPTLTSIIDIPSKLGKSCQSTSISSSKNMSKTCPTPSDHKEKLLKILICSVCLGDHSSDSDEIVECDSCGITVHENCYGIIADDSDNESIHSNVSSASTEPWFCDACKAGVSNLSCELCPSEVGIFKRTDTQQWVHVVCALYTNGVTFSDTLRLSGITLLELAYDRWGSKACSLCEDSRLAKTGIAISCDAGLCRTYFHVTCAQKYGLLQDVADLEQETEIVDPFYAHCKLHTTDKAKMKRKKRNYLTLEARIKIKCEDSSPLPTRTAKKLDNARNKFKLAYEASTKPTVNTTDKIPRALTSSPSSVKMLIKKADLLGYGSISTFDPLETRRKWHLPPAFSVEFVAYFIDRAQRIKSMEEKIKTLKVQEQQLKHLESISLRSCNETMPMYEKLKKQSTELREKSKNFWIKLSQISQLPAPIVPDNLLQVQPCKEPSTHNRSRTSSFLAKKLANNEASKVKKSTSQSTVSFLNALHPSSISKISPNLGTCNVSSTNSNSLVNSSLSSLLCKSPVKHRLSLHECGHCKSMKDQHLLALCDSCNFHYHLYCLDPPLTRMPKKTKFGGWQCSDCTEKQDLQYSEGKELENLTGNGDDDGTDGTSGRKRMRKEPIKFIPDADSVITVTKKSKQNNSGQKVYVTDEVKRKKAAERMRNRRAFLKAERMKKQANGFSIDTEKSSNCTLNSSVIESDNICGPITIVIKKEKAPPKPPKEMECVKCNNVSSVKEMVM